MLVILGPTACGKSQLALELAARCGGQILSVDSMQVYRGMDIGTAKPTAAEQARVKHHLIDLVDPNQSFTVARFVELADQVIADAAASQTPLILAGGTPLYYKSLFEGLFDGPAADPELRAQFSQQTTEQLHNRLREVDPAAADRIQANDRRRLTRALEVHQLTGQTISSLQTEWAAPSMRHQAVWVGLNWDRLVLSQRINSRVKAMIASGWPEETRQLLACYGQLSATASQAAGYTYLIEHLQGRFSLDQTIERIKIATRQLSRRQIKWFRRFQQVHWIPGQLPLEQQVEQAERIWMASEA